MAEQTAPALDLEPLYEPPADLKSRLKASYDAIAPRYDEWTIPHSTTRLHYLGQLLGRLPTTSAPSTPVSVLELGCGYGVPVTQKLLAQPNFSVTANDLSSAQLALARVSLLLDPPSPAHERLTLLEGDMLALDFAPATFNAVTGMYSIIHLPRAEQVEMLRKIVAWLKPGGWVLANFAAEESAGNEMQNWLEEEKGWMFWSGWGSEGTVEKVRGAGLEVVVQETVEDVVDAKFLWILARKSNSQKRKIDDERCRIDGLVYSKDCGAACYDWLLRSRLPNGNAKEARERNRTVEIPQFVPIRKTRDFQERKEATWRHVGTEAG